MDENQVRQIIRNELRDFIVTDKYIFQKLVQFLDGRNIQLGKTTGTKLGTATSQKLAFWNTTPVVQPVTVIDPTGGSVIDVQAREAVVSILGRLKELGLIAS